MDKMLLKLPMPIETERLTIRPYQAEDGDMLWEVVERNRAHLARYESGNYILTAKSAAEAERVARKMGEGWKRREYFFLAGFEKESGEFVNQVYIGAENWELPEFVVGYFLDVGQQGQGYMTEAVRAVLGYIFEYMKAHRVRLECDDTNLRSQKLAERCGFLREGHFRENKRNPDGSISGTMHYGLLREGWENEE